MAKNDSKKAETGRKEHDGRAQASNNRPSDPKSNELELTTIPLRPSTLRSWVPLILNNFRELTFRTHQPVEVQLKRSRP